MAGDNEVVAVSKTSPHFFSVIIKEKLQDNKLFIPKIFVKKYGKGLSSPVIVRLPCGSNWKMELIKLDDGQICLQNGWPEFMKHYSFGVGHFVVFRYEGNSHFYAIIFDKTATEIDYSSFPSHLDEPNVGSDLQVPKRKEVEEELGFPTKDKKGKSRKRKYEDIRASEGGKVQVEPEISPTNLTEPGGATPNNGQGMPVSCSNFPAKQARGCWSNPPNTWWNPVTMKRGRPLNFLEKARILERVPFESENPFFKIVLQRSHVSANDFSIPEDFAARYLRCKNGSSVTLRVPPSSRCWSCNFKVVPLKCGKYRRSFYNGWRAFALENNLKVGDVCIFELTNDTELSIDVSIVRVVDNPYCQLFEAQHRSLRTREKVGVLERAPFESEKPIFKIVMQPSYIINVLPLPVYTNRYFKNKNGSAITLRVPPSRCWSCKYKGSPLKCGRYRAKFNDGWKEFAKENNLKVGDVCIFELTDESNMTIDVSIIQGSEECDAPTKVLKPISNIVDTVELD